MATTEFHTPHEVYARPILPNSTWSRVATFELRKWAEEYAQWKRTEQAYSIVTVEFEVRSV